MQWKLKNLILWMIVHLEIQFISNLMNVWCVKQKYLIFQIFVLIIVLIKIKILSHNFVLIVFKKIALNLKKLLGLQRDLDQKNIDSNQLEKS